MDARSAAGLSEQGTSCRKMHRVAETAEKELMPVHNSALKYYEGAVLAAAAKKQIAYEFLRKAVAERILCARGVAGRSAAGRRARRRGLRRIVHEAATCQAQVGVTHDPAK